MCMLLNQPYSLSAEHCEHYLEILVVIKKKLLLSSYRAAWNADAV